MLDVRAIGKGFFDTAAVLAKLSEGERRVLSKYGAFVRIDARRSIRSRKKSAAPGQPPSSHEGSLKRLIFFAYDSVSRSVVIGPVPFKRGTVPSLLEYGGRVTRTLYELSGGRLVGPGSPLLKGNPGSRPTVTRSANYKGNPFMGPAAARVNGKLAPELATLLG